jgi:hypothetical protein
MTPRKPHPIESLSFVADGSPKSRVNVKRSFWNVEPTGDYAADCDTGSALAIEYLRFEAEQATHGDTHGHLGMIVEHMPDKHTGIEVAFFHVIDHAARYGLHAAERLLDHYKRCDLARTHGSLVATRSDGTVVIEQADGTRAVYRKEARCQKGGAA